MIAWQPYSLSPTHVHNLVDLLALLGDQSLKVWPKTIDQALSV